MSVKLSTGEFIKKSNIVHGNTYCYIKSNYVDIRGNITITCRDHGDFETTPYRHIYSNSGCKKCKSKKQSESQIISNDECISRFKKIHGDTYDYSNVIYKGVKSKVDIICSDHGKFQQAPQKHWSGRGCFECAHSKRKLSINKDIGYFINKAKLIHGDSYIYSESIYISAHDNIDIICKKHGKFTQKAYSHLNGRGCAKCRGRYSSKQEKEVMSYIKSIYDAEVLENDRDILGGKELDIVIPEKKIAIEYCGLYWHSEMKGVNRNYHLDKLNGCRNKGYRLITIFSDEWILKRGIVESKIKSILGLSKDRVYARKCEIKEITSIRKSEFLSKYHIQGNISSSINIGLFHNEDLVSVLTFRKNKKGYDLSRFASSIQVVGGFSKMLSFFKNIYNPKYIYTFADLRYSDGNLYMKTGFSKIYETKPNYFYFTGLTRYSRLAFQKHKLKDKLDNFNPNETESMNMANNGYNRIFDCGNIKFEMRI
jgi:hypothetical protein